MLVPATEGAARSPGIWPGISRNRPATIPNTPRERFFGGNRRLALSPQTHVTSWWASVPDASAHVVGSSNQSITTSELTLVADANVSELREGLHGQFRQSA